jgi:hypothetical protein
MKVGQKQNQCKRGAKNSQSKHRRVNIGILLLLRINFGNGRRAVSFLTQIPVEPWKKSSTILVHQGSIHQSEIIFPSHSVTHRTTLFYFIFFPFCIYLNLVIFPLSFVFLLFLLHFTLFLFLNLIFPPKGIGGEGVFSNRYSPDCG